MKNIFKNLEFIYWVAIFLALNFWALAIGSIWTSWWATSDWYTSLNQAPWTPPGWFFGFAWTSIMVCFSFYMALAWNKVKSQKMLTILFGIQWVLNIIWNPIFFWGREFLLWLITISSLTILMTFFLIYYYRDLKLISILVLPYVLWLITATSLNWYILFMNS